MAKKTTVHMFVTEDIVRSVLKGHKVMAACGFVKVHTREEIDGTPGLLESGRGKHCADCHKAVNDIEGDTTLNPARGWLALLERAWVQQHDAEVASQKITIRMTGTFPLAA